jgi:branched-chain amino acid transport system ATP-binding protein
MLAVGRALISRPRIVLIDEPSAGLAPAVIEELLESLSVIRQTGVTLLLVEQNIRFGLRLADSALLLQRGRIVYSGATGDLDSEQLASYLGVGRLLRDDLAAGLRGGATTSRPPRRSRSRAKT